MANIPFQADKQCSNHEPETLRGVGIISRRTLKGIPRPRRKHVKQTIYIRLRHRFDELMGKLIAYLVDSQQSEPLRYIQRKQTDGKIDFQPELQTPDKILMPVGEGFDNQVMEGRFYALES